MRKINSFLFFTLGFLFFNSCTSNYIGRWAFWGPATNKDYKKFPTRSIAAGSSSFQFKSDTLAKQKFSNFITAFQDSIITQSGAKNLDDLLAANGSTAFLVARGDTLLYEKYFNGYDHNSINCSFSIAKSIVSALIGIAIDEGYIHSVDDSIVKYIPELKDPGCAQITIRQLLMMSSGIQYTDCGKPWCDEPKTYFKPDLRKLALGVKAGYKPGHVFDYNNYHPLLLGLILERVTHQSVSSYLQKKLWEPLGMESSALWALDSKKDGFEKMEGNIYARAIDFLKFGVLYLNNGNWNGKQLVPEPWVAESTQRDSLDTAKNKTYYPGFMRSSNMYYKYFWWGYSNSNKSYDYFALGNRGQYIYVCPAKNLVICRFGNEYGKIHRNWEPLFRNLADKMYK